MSSAKPSARQRRNGSREGIGAAPATARPHPDGAGADPSGPAAPGGDHADAGVPRIVPWMVLVVAVVLLADVGLPAGWVYGWTREGTPGWARTAFLWSGLIATVTFVHACIAVQAAAVARRAGERERRAAISVYRVSGAFTAGGALAGTLLAFVSADQLPAGLKLTALASDLAMVGTAVALAVAAPFFVFRTWTALGRLYVLDRRTFRNASSRWSSSTAGSGTGSSGCCRRTSTSCTCSPPCSECPQRAGRARATASAVSRAPAVATPVGAGQR